MDCRLRSMRRPAVNEPGHAHELTFCCFRRYAFLQSERTCQRLAESLEEARRKMGFALWAYVFMPEHVHVLIHPHCLGYDIGIILKQIKEPIGLRPEDWKWSSASWCAGKNSLKPDPIDFGGTALLADGRG